MPQSSSPAPQPRRLQRAARRRAQRIRGVVKATLGGLALTFFMLTGIGGSYAMWTSTATVDAGTITTGTAELVAAPADPAASWSDMLPGEALGRPVVLTNRGDVPLAVTVAPAAQTEWTLRVLATCGADTPVPAIQPGEVLTVCLEVKAPLTLLPGQTAAFTAVFTGTQVPR
ncbi:SipW-dependent-type signal peptide-containing protein [Microbacterium sp. NPDC096154]|uniref:SipW-dependent-type signal peptide-containing protein n=1 Tax=Microbacterium sp. NPDC096154 TaxID=3155549 RepID=UPI00331F5301